MRSTEFVQWNPTSSMCGYHRLRVNPFDNAYIVSKLSLRTRGAATDATLSRANSFAPLLRSLCSLQVSPICTEFVQWNPTSSMCGYHRLRANPSDNAYIVSKLCLQLAAPQKLKYFHQQKAPHLRCNLFKIVVFQITCSTKNFRYCVSSAQRRDGWSGAWDLISTVRTRRPLSLAASVSIFSKSGNVI